MSARLAWPTSEMWRCERGRSVSEGTALARRTCLFEREETHIVSIAPLVEAEDDLGVLAMMLNVREEEVADAASEPVQRQFDFQQELRAVRDSTYPMTGTSKYCEVVRQERMPRASSSKMTWKALMRMTAGSCGS